jgi:hypothetical protein
MSEPEPTSQPSLYKTIQEEVHRRANEARSISAKGQQRDAVLDIHMNTRVEQLSYIVFQRENYHQGNRGGGPEASRGESLMSDEKAVSLYRCVQSATMIREPPAVRRIIGHPVIQA